MKIPGMPGIFYALYLGVLLAIYTPAKITINAATCINVIYSL